MTTVFYQKGSRKVRQDFRKIRKVRLSRLTDSLQFLRYFCVLFLEFNVAGKIT